MPKTTQKTVLFCPLDWGLGHIARDMPLIREYSDHGHRVVVAASEKICQWLQCEAPEIETIIFKGPVITYSDHGFSFARILLQLPGLLRWPTKEKRRVAKLVDIFQPHLIISDNRYGARHPKVRSVIITHQLCIKLPHSLKRAEYPLHLWVKSLIKKFDECWIPDFPKKNSLAGDLVHKYPLPKNAFLIGPLSRFDGIHVPVNSISPDHSFLGIISGPEPQRSIFEKLLIEVLKQHKEKKTLITGKLEPPDEKQKKTGNWSILTHQCTHEMIKIITNHDIIISRSGYSTLMDMYYLKRNIVIVPTPRQTEQEYLADYHDKKGHIKIEQEKIEYTDLLKLSTRIKQFKKIKPSINFRTVLQSSLEIPGQRTKDFLNQQQNLL